jgi:hypothetical protein
MTHNHAILHHSLRILYHVTLPSVAVYIDGSDTQPTQIWSPFILSRTLAAVQLLSLIFAPQHLSTLPSPLPQVRLIFVCVCGYCCNTQRRLEQNQA